MPDLSVARQTADLTSCDREPIHLPGSIQPHGFLLHIAGPELVIVQASANAADHLEKTTDAILNRPLSQVIGPDGSRRIESILPEIDLHSRTFYVDALKLENGLVYNAVAHRQKESILVEFEPASRSSGADFRLMFSLARSFLSELREAGTLEAISLLAAREIKAMSGFGRVMVYRFDEHYNGQVIAEVKDECYHSYLHQRFPASDIPRQAREMYLLSHIRLIADADYIPSPLVPATNPLTGAPTDLTFAGLRSVSPVHLEYMRNMGTMASMSISLVVQGKLWGLIACHHADPRHLPFEVRAACEQLGQIVSLQLEAREETEETNHRLELRRMLVSMLSALSSGPDFVGNLAANGHLLLQFANASGAAIVFEGQMIKIGDTPETDEISQLLDWIGDEHNDDIFHTHSLSALYPHAAPLREKASGVMALPISKIHRHYLVWFRPEVVQTIEWAGNPYWKAASPDPDKPLTPRRSFSIWRENVFGTALAWRKSEIESALEFRVAMLGIVLRRAEEMAELAEELGRANKELESFSYSVSHDLRAPLRHIVGYTDLLAQYEGENLTERGNRFLKNIIDSARFAGKLVDDLLSFSQMGRASLRRREIDLSDIVRGVIKLLGTETRERRIDWEIEPLPQVLADPVFMQLAMQNLLSNAVKYTRQREHARIRISSEETDDEHIIHVADNGVGFNMKYVQKLFGVFQRLHRMEEFEGTGIGLANVRRIVERHGGRTWAEGVPDEGATFSFSIPKTLHATAEDRHA